MSAYSITRPHHEAIMNYTLMCRIVLFPCGNMTIFVFFIIFQFWNCTLWFQLAVPLQSPGSRQLIEQGSSHWGKIQIHRLSLYLCRWVARSAGPLIKLRILAWNVASRKSHQVETHIHDNCVSLTHWGRVTHICVSKLTIIGSDNGLVPCHYLNHYWNIVNWALKNKLQWNFNRNSDIFIQENALENVVWEMASILSWPQYVKTIQQIQGSFSRQKFL